ncbi:hypothetical protein F5Y16DRAFT_386605 [Xylariaceae sp. FL0255]|nr:hypothetical protein F5Y16DRAFT_386605 [Xylariaceae sp. FL0255]
MDLWNGMKRNQYNVLPDNEFASPSRSVSWFSGPLTVSKTTLIALVILSSSIFSGISGYIVGKNPPSSESQELVQLNTVPVTFEYEFNFAEAPSDLTSQRWESLFPSRGGFFEHPDVGDSPVSFSVFHQLHCLDGIRYAYWTARNGNYSGEEHSHHAEHSSDIHVRHCLEYIRQSLMCVADTTIEQTVEAPEGGSGVRGFGTEHTCKDYQQLVEWTSHWESQRGAI